MINYLITLKLFALVMAIWHTEVNLAKIYYKGKVSATCFAIQSLSIVVFLALQFNLFN